MQDFEKNNGSHDEQNVQDAVNTLSKASGNEKYSQEYAARAAEAYAQNQSQAQNFNGGAAFNANGNPENPEQNISYEEENHEIDPMADIDGAVGVNEVEDASDYAEQINDLRGQIEILKKQVADERNKALREAADAENVKKRALQDIERERKYSLEKFVRSLLPIHDALERALELTDRENEATKATVEGLENTMSLFLKEMASFGVERIDPTGQPFDPNFHQAISMVPSPEVPENHVLSTMQKGFLLNGRVVRPAMVVVAKINQ